VATAVFFHAHPDDEAIATGGTMAKAAAHGHRVVLVTATQGEHGEVADGFLDVGESLASRRVTELETAAQLLGVSRLAFLGYVDSGMAGTAENGAPQSFWQADIDEAAARLARILDEEQADVLTIYDEHGGYGHPDHIQVHRVGARAAELAGTLRVFEATINRDDVRSMLEAAAAAGGPAGEMAAELMKGGLDQAGVPGALVNTTIDVRSFIQRKRRALFAHRSQVDESSWLTKMPEDAFVEAFARESFILRDPPADWGGDDLFAGLP
jgi:LmbE family N-acetylglucosaminyl deacetylase